MGHDKLDYLTNEIEQGFMQRGGWKACRYLLGKLVDDHDKAVAYYKIGAMSGRTVKPPFVPSRVRLERQVSGDFSIGLLTHQGPGEFDCECNQYGAVSVVATNGEMLGLRLDEFEPIAWRVNEHTEAEAKDECPEMP